MSLRYLSPRAKNLILRKRQKNVKNIDKITKSDEIYMVSIRFNLIFVI